jgi:hypothetical protein
VAIIDAKAASSMANNAACHSEVNKLPLPPTIQASTMTSSSAPGVVGNKRKLRDLGAKELGILLDKEHYEMLKEQFAAKKISGKVLSFCESADDLMEEPYALRNRKIAEGFIKDIRVWDEEDVEL